jgi:hypothetical protein
MSGDNKAKARAHYRKVRGEVAVMLGYGGDLDKLSAGQAMRLDAVCALKLSLDEMRTRLLRGESVDTMKMLAASEALEKHLPAPPVVARASASAARARLEQLVLNAVAADRHELAARAERGEELSEADALRLRLAQLEEQPTPVVEPDEPMATPGALAEALARIEQLEDEARHLRGTKPRRLAPPSEKPLKPVTKSEPAKPTTAANASKSDANASSSAKPPPGYDPITNGLWRSPVAASAASPAPAPAPPRSENWDDTPNGQAWRQWHDAGGGGGPFGPTPWSDGLPAQGWLSKLNGREY